MSNNMMIMLNTTTATLRRRLRTAVITMLTVLAAMPATAQTDDNDVWREVDLSEVNFQKEKNYCMRLYGFYRYVTDGTAYGAGRQSKVFSVYEGICILDVRYDRKEDEGAEIIVGRNLVHPDRSGDAMDWYELQPYTFLEKARRKPKRFTLEESGDTTRILTRKGLAGTAVRDTARRELHISYNPIAPDTSKTINLLIVSGHLTHMKTDAVYRLDNADDIYVPQGNLQRITFEGDWNVQIYPGTGAVHGEYRTDGESREFVRMETHEHCEFYVDSVVYLTREEYRADRRLSNEQRRQQSGYTDADIDRLRERLGVPPLSAAMLQRIEDQRDWEDREKHWEHTNKAVRALNKYGEQVQKIADEMKNDPRVQKAMDAAEKAIEKQVQTDDDE